MVTALIGALLLIEVAYFVEYSTVCHNNDSSLCCSSEVQNYVPTCVACI